MPADAASRNRRKVVAIVQARMGSTRLPGKALLEVGTRPMIGHVVERVGRARQVDEVWVATTTREDDDAIEALCERNGWPVFRGSESDVLDRYVGCARAAAADVVVRVTSDCPLLDPGLVDAVVAALLREEADYASNTAEPRTYPRGLDVEAVTREAIERAGAEAREPHEREHVTPYIYREGGDFTRVALRSERDRSRHRWTVDTPEDLALVRRIAEHFGPRLDLVGWREVLAVVEGHPDRFASNAHVRQKSLVP